MISEVEAGRPHNLLCAERRQTWNRQGGIGPQYRTLSVLNKPGQPRRQWEPRRQQRQHQRQRQRRRQRQMMARGTKTGTLCAPLTLASVYFPQPQTCCRP